MSNLLWLACAIAALVVAAYLIVVILYPQKF